MLRSSKRTMTPSERKWQPEMSWKRKDIKITIAVLTFNIIILGICWYHITESAFRYCFNMKTTIEGRTVRQKMTTSDLKTVENACDEALRWENACSTFYAVASKNHLFWTKWLCRWLEMHQGADLEELQERRKVAEAACGPCITRLYQVLPLFNTFEYPSWLNQGIFPSFFLFSIFNCYSRSLKQQCQIWMGWTWVAPPSAWEEGGRKRRGRGRSTEPCIQMFLISILSTLFKYTLISLNDMHFAGSLFWL